MKHIKYIKNLWVYNDTEKIALIPLKDPGYQLVKINTENDRYFAAFPVKLCQCDPVANEGKYFCRKILANKCKKNDRI